MPTQPALDPLTGRRTDGGAEPDRLALLTRLTGEFASVVPDVDPETPVPACGDWTAAELVLHLAGIHYWAAGMATGDDARDENLSHPGGGAAELAALYAQHATVLRRTLADAGADGAGVTLIGPGPASFWWRRQGHETLVHLHDLHAARLGSATGALGVVDVEPWLWGDAVDEVVTMFLPRQVARGRMTPLTDRLVLEASDLGWSWALGPERDPEGGEGTASATLSAPAHRLALLLWGRLSLEEAGAVVDGDDAAARRVLRAPMVP